MADEILDELPVVDEETDFESAFNEHAEAKEVIEEVDDDPTPDTIVAQDDESGDEPVPAEEEIDIYAGMSEEAKAQFDSLKQSNEDLTHRLNSDAGRVSAFQRKINGLEKDIQAIREGSTAGQPSNNQIADAMGGGDDEWSQFSEDYPEVAKAIDNRLGKAGQATQESINSTLAPVKEKHAQDMEREAEAAAKAAAQPLTDLYPEWVPAINSNEYNLWLDVQPPGIKALHDSHDTADAITLLGMYDSHLVANGLPTLKATPGLGVDDTQEVLKDEQESKLKAKRERQLQDGSTVPSKSAGVDPSGESGDKFELAFNHFAKKREVQRRA